MWRGEGEGPGTPQRTWRSPPCEEEELAAGRRGNIGTEKEVALERVSGWEERSELQSRTQTRVSLCGCGIYAVLERMGVVWLGRGKQQSGILTVGK